MNDIRLIVFDCDGTLVDSAHTVVSSIEAAWIALGLTPPPGNTIRQSIGLSLERAIVYLAQEQSRETQVALMDAFREDYHAARSAGAHEEPLYEGCEAVLRSLAADPNTVLGVATGKGRRGLRITLETHGLSELFSVLKTADDGPSKPDPTILLDAVNEIGVSPWNTIMIGDTVFDMALAQRAGVHALGVAWGYHPPSELTKAGASSVADTYLEIPGLVNALRGKKA